MNENDITIGNERLIDREFAWIAFNQKVLEEAQNKENPLMERARFLGIVSNNLDEFFEIRVASLLQKVESGVAVDGIAKLETSQKLDGLLKCCQRLVKDQYKCWTQDLLPLLTAAGLQIKSMENLDEKRMKELYRFFRRNIYHLLTPIKVDPAHPFPGVANKALCIALTLREQNPLRESLGVVTVPRNLPRLVAVPSKEEPNSFVFLYQVIQHFLSDMFKGYQIDGSTPFRVTRNSNLYLEEEEVSNLLETVEAIIKERRKGDVVRLEIDKNAPKKIVEALAANFEIDNSVMFRVDGPINLARLSNLYNQVGFKELKFPPATPVSAYSHLSSGELLDEIKTKDILLHHPFDSFSPVVHFIESICNDPNVIAIKQTLYRTSEDSPIMNSLIEAARRGKEVVAVVELKARFDEKSNIDWAKKLEREGVIVVYGLVGLKTHCKLALVIRNEEGGIAQYAHIGTGNYNHETAKLYTDLSLFTCNRAITEEVADVFNYLTSHSPSPDFKTLLVGPINFLPRILEMIRNEIENAKAGKTARISIKMNSLFDAEVINALYEASSAGVDVQLMIRGICALRPGVKNLSERIQVRSIVGRYLEHSRIYYFENAGDPLVYIGSGDLMERNLRRRVEVLVPIQDAVLREQLMEILAVYWADNVKARVMREDGRYDRRGLGQAQNRIQAQEVLMARDRDLIVDIRKHSPLFNAQGQAQIALDAAALVSETIGKNSDAELGAVNNQKSPNQIANPSPNQNHNDSQSPQVIDPRGPAMVVSTPGEEPN